MIAYCGIKCTVCDAYIATQTNDDAKRKELAELAKKDYEIDANPADINCDGCKAATGVQISYCSQCQIRACAIEKEFKTCAECQEFESCQKLAFIFEKNTDAKNNLLELRG